MLKTCLTILIGAFLVKFIRDVESRSELFLAFSFSFLFGCCISSCIVSYLLYKRNKKISVEIELVIKDYNAVAIFLTNSYIPKKREKKKYEWCEHDLMTYIDNLKHEQFVEDMDSHFSRVKISNFDLIHHQCCGDKLQNSRRHCETIFDSDFKDYDDCTRNHANRLPLKRSVTIFISSTIF